MIPVIRVLDDLVKAGIVREYVIGGATALLYFSKPTFTDDIDVFIYFTQPSSGLIDLSPIYKYLVDQKGAITKDEHIVVEGYPIQFLLPYDDLSREAFDKAIAVTVQGAQVRIFDLEYLMAIMIQLGKPKYMERLRILIENREFDEDKLNGILGRFNLTARWARMKEGLMSKYE